MESNEAVVQKADDMEVIISKSVFAVGRVVKSVSGAITKFAMII